MINRRRKVDNFNPEEIINDNPIKEPSLKKKRSEVSKKLLHDEVTRLRKEEAEKWNKLVAMLEEQQALLQKLIKTDEAVHEETSKTTGIEDLEAIADDMEKKNKIIKHEENSDYILAAIEKIDSKDFEKLVNYFEKYYDFDIVLEQEVLMQDGNDDISADVILENWIIEKDFGDDNREQIINDIESGKYLE